MKVVKVLFSNGDHIVTSINGTKEEIQRYYVGNVFNIGLGPLDNLAKAVSVEFLVGEDPPPEFCK